MLILAATLATLIQAQSLVTTPAPALSHNDPVRIALVIGYNQSDTQDTADLRYADDDAIATHQMLQRAGVDSTLLLEPDSDTLRLHPETETSLPPSRENLLWAYEQILSRISKLKAAGRTTELIFAYSGHGGLEHGEGYIVLQNGRLTRSELHEKVLNRSNATRNHVIIDACKSFFVVFEKGAGGGQRQFYPGHYVKDVRQSLFHNTGFILSTSSDRDSHEWEKYQAGVFSHEVRSGLWGAADMDADGMVSYAELGAFLTVANQAIPNAKYRPDFVIRPPGPPPGNLDQGLLLWPTTQSSLLLDDVNAGHLYVESSTGQRIMDINVQPEKPILLQLPEERPIFIRRNDNSAEYQIDQQELVSLSALVPMPNSMNVKGARHLAFEDLFGAPFSQKAVDKYKECYAIFGDPLRLDLVDHFKQLDTIATTQEIAYWTAGTTLILGVAAHVSAFAINQGHGEAAQTERIKANTQIDSLNKVAISMYALAGAAATTWLVAKLWPVEDVKDQKDIDLSLAVLPNYTGLALTLPLE